MTIRLALIAGAALVPLFVLAQAASITPDAPDLSSKPRHGVVESATTGGDGRRFVIRQDMADTGSNIRRPVATGSVPFDKRYDELTAEQQANVRSLYQQLGPRDEPPFPVNGLATVYKAISTAQNLLHVQGNLSMFVEIDAKGEPQSVKVFESPDPKMTRAVASILMLEKYKPALCDGTPCAMGFPVRLTLEMR
ncbi:MAG TPA: hypothetical protein VK996_05015 [Ramlibacter sp.]|nr:hypothetical protein [Ramlibacter sp.]